MVVELFCQNGALRLTGPRGGWCQVGALLGGTTFHLGAEVQSVVAARLSVALAPELHGPWVEGGAGRFTFVLTLSERHSTIYARDSGQTRVLLCQDADGADVGQLELTAADRLRWMGQLTSSIPQMK